MTTPATPPRPTAADISVIVPVYNGNRTLAEALTTVLEQTSPPGEVIVVDDGSPEDPAPVVRALDSRHDIDITVIRQPNAGPAAARNRGIETARGSLLAFIDQDDRWHLQKLERQLALFASDPSVDLCYTHVDLFWDAADDGDAKLAAEAAAYRDHARAKSVPGYAAPTLLARRSAFERVGKLDEQLRFGDGSEWAMRAKDAGLHVALLPDVLLYHRMHASNLTREREDSKQEFLNIVRARLQRQRAAGAVTDGEGSA